MPSEIPFPTSLPDGASKWLTLINAAVDVLNSDMSTITLGKPAWDGLLPPFTPCFIQRTSVLGFPNDIPLVREFDLNGGQFYGLTLAWAGQESSGLGSNKDNALEHVRIATWGYLPMPHNETPGTVGYAGVTQLDSGLYTSQGSGRRPIGTFMEADTFFLNPDLSE